MAPCKFLTPRTCSPHLLLSILVLEQMKYKTKAHFAADVKRKEGLDENSFFHQSDVHCLEILTIRVSNIKTKIKTHLANEVQDKDSFRCRCEEKKRGLDDLFFFFMRLSFIVPKFSTFVAATSRPRSRHTSPLLITDNEKQELVSSQRHLPLLYLIFFVLFQKGRSLAA